MQLGVSHAGKPKASLVLMSSPAFNAFCLACPQKVVEQSKSWSDHQREWIIDRVKVSLIAMNETLEAHFFSGAIHSLAVEGMLLQCLASVDFGKYLPWASCADAAVSREQSFQILDPMDTPWLL